MVALLGLILNDISEMIDIVKFLISIIVFILLLLFTQSAHAQEYFFQDEFIGNALDNTKWQAYPNNGTITLGNDMVWLRSGHTKTFPFVYSKSNPIPSSGDFSVEFKLQYTEVTFWGTGVVLSSETPVNGQSEPTNPIFKAWVWDDTSTGNNGFRIDFKDSNNLHPVYSKSPIDLNPHVIKLDYIEGIYKIYLDNNLIYTSTQTNNKPNVIWFGNPANTGVFPNWNWTAFKLDYIRVKSLQPSKTPLILIPGIGGSELKVNEITNWNKDNSHGGVYNRVYGQDEKVWVNEGEAGNPGNDEYFDVLRMKTDGINSEANLGLTGNLYSGAYGGAINFFTSNGYTLNQDFFVFPYDWRKDIGLTKDLLDQKISQIKTQTGSQKVDIVTHSMGGLVARNYIADPAKAQNVRKLFTLGTPHLGSPYFLKALRYGVQLEPVLLLGLIKLEPSAVKDVIQNMISGFQLAPTQSYFNFYADEDNSHPYPYRTEIGSLNYLQIKNLLTILGHTTSLFNPSEIFHTLDNFLSNTNGVEVTIIAGSGKNTLGQIIEKTLTSLNGNKILQKDMLNINGDETVPLLSASINDPHKGLFLNGPAQVLYTNQKHGELPGNGPALNLVKNILEGDNQLPSGVSTTPYKLFGQLLSVHSPVNIHVYDANNNHTGPLPNGDFEVNIPGSSYDTLGDAKFIFLPEEGQYTINFEATDNGSFDFKIRDFENDVNTQTILYNDVPINSTSTGQTILDTQSSEAPILQIDQQTVNPPVILTGNANYDETPPVTTIQLSGTQGNNNWYKSDVLVTLTANDESGIEKITYTLDNGQTIQTYTNPFAVSQEGIFKLKVKTIDKAGNEEVPQEKEIKIDKTPPEALIQFNLQTQNLEINGSEITPGEVILQDEAGNTTKLQVEPKDKKRKEKLEIKTISYNESSPIKLPDNKFEVGFELDKKSGKLKEFEQKIKIKGEEKIKAEYNSKKNITKIELKENKEKNQKIEKDGIILLQLKTNKGQLETNF